MTIRFPQICGTVLALALFSALPAIAQTNLRVTIPVLPPQLGNPFATAATPTITTTSAIYDGLTRISPDGTLKPWLATSWSAVDTTTWRFQLRKDVKFSNGKPFNAKAVAATVTYLTTSPKPTDNILRDLPPMLSASVVDEFTVDIKTKAPVPTFPRYASVLLIPEPDAFQTLGSEEFAKQPVGTGPFAVEKFEPGKATFKAFAGSWRKPKVDAMEILGLPEATSRVQALISGRADVATALGPEDMQTLQEAGHQGVTWQDGTVSGISLVNTRQLPFNDVRVRQALNYAVNRKPIIDVLMQGKTVASSQPAGRATLGYDPSLPLYEYDVAKAKKLLADAGYPDGFKFTMETSTATGALLSTYQQVADDLADVGVMMEIRLIQGPQYLKNVFITGEYGDALIIPWQATPTLDVLRPITIHSCMALHAWYCDKDAMPILQAAMAEWDDAKGLELRRALSKRYHEQAASLFLYEQVYFAGVSKRTTGFADNFGFVMYDQIAVSEK